MLVLGLTGTIAAGKSTALAMFTAEGAAGWSADAAVHALYAGGTTADIEAAFPGTTANGTVDRERLAARVAGDRAALLKLEAIVHPLVRAAEAEFRAQAMREGRRVAVLDIPLLFETGGEGRVDAVVVVSAPEDIRRERFLRRDSVDAARFAELSARQMSDAEKRARAHFVIESSGDFRATRKQVRDILRAVAGMAAGQ
jgi:dephospho-CoA kinase